MFKIRKIMLGIVLCLMLFLTACALFEDGDNGDVPTVEVGENEMTAFVYHYEMLSAQCMGFKVDVTIKQNCKEQKVIKGIHATGMTKFNNHTGIDFSQPMSITVKVVEIEGDCSPLYVGLELGPFNVTMKWDKSKKGYTVAIDTDISLGLKMYFLFGWP